MRVDSTKFGNETHFMNFTAIVATRNETEGSNFDIWNTVIAKIEMSGNRLISIAAFDSTAMLTKPCPQTSSSTFNAWDAVNVMGRSTSEMVLDVELRFWCRNSGRGINNYACDVTLSVYSHRTSLKNMPGHGGNRTYDLWNTSPMLCQLSYAVRSVRVCDISKLSLVPSISM